MKNKNSLIISILGFFGLVMVFAYGCSNKDHNSSLETNAIMNEAGSVVRTYNTKTGLTQVETRTETGILVTFEQGNTEIQ